LSVELEDNLDFLGVSVMNRPIKLTAMLSLVLAISFIAGCFGGSVEGVRIEEIAKGDVSKVVSAVGVLEAAEPVDVTPAVSATIVSLPVKEGDYVKAGDVLAVLDQQELAAQEAQARANYYTSASIGDILEGQYSTFASVFEGIQYADQVFQFMQQQVDSAVLSLYDIVPALMPFLPVAQQEYLKSLLADQRANYLASINSRPQPPQVSASGYPESASAADAARTEAAGYKYEQVVQGTKSPNITAPVSGYVVFAAQQSALSSDILSQMLGGLGSLTSSMGSLTSLMGVDLSSALGGTGQGGEIKAGSKVTAGQPAFQIVDLQDMKVNAQVEETDIPDVRQGQAVKIYLDAYPDLTFTGKVIQVDVKSQTGSAGTTVFPVVVQVDRTDIPLRLGYNATVDITVLGRVDVISLPVTAIIPENGKSYVYVVEDGKARLQEISTGDSTKEWVEVISGLEEGDRVIIEGVGKVKEGQKVE
jgi:HlyD family secretion protein